MACVSGGIDVNWLVLAAACCVRGLVSGGGRGGGVVWGWRCWWWVLCWLGVRASLWVVWVLCVCAVWPLRFLIGCGAGVRVGGGRMGGGHLSSCRGSMRVVRALRVCGTRRTSLLGTCLCALVVAGSVPLWRASWLRVVRRASSGLVALGAPVGFPVAVVPFPTPGACAPGFPGWRAGHAEAGRELSASLWPRRGGGYIYVCIYTYCMYMSVCIYIYMYVYIYTYQYIYICIYVCMYICGISCDAPLHRDLWAGAGWGPRNLPYFGSRTSEKKRRKDPIQRWPAMTLQSCKK